MKKIIALTMGLIACSGLVACGGSGGGGGDTPVERDGNDIFKYYDNPTYLLKGAFTLGIYKKSEAEYIKAQMGEQPAAVWNDCVYMVSETISQIKKGDNDVIEIPLYDTTKEEENVPLSFFTEPREKIDDSGNTYTFLKDGKWALENDVYFDLHFMPDYQPTAGAINHYTFWYNFDYEFSFYKYDELGVKIPVVIPVVEYGHSNIDRSCFNGCVIDEQFKVPFVSEEYPDILDTKDVYKPTLRITKINDARAKIAFSEQYKDEAKHMDKYIRKA